MNQNNKLELTQAGLNTFAELVAKVNQGFELDNKECMKLIILANLVDLTKLNITKPMVEQALVYAYDNVQF